MTVFNNWTCLRHKKAKENFSENHFQHILRNFDVFQIFPSPQVKQSTSISKKDGI